ncbi:interferon-induced protein 44-like [Clupea harengus]|uniref:Interferon-induced protein 44-like n=1 Tax=Clupea harengus TaxID=7950 RepID=A0A8M1K6H7_CLUHA|nr:interferon-induced protein 44-like [Clupea harengus]
MGTAPLAPQLKGNSTFNQNTDITGISVKRGQDITFRCDANCEVYGTWKKDGLTLHNDGRIIITEPTQYRCFNLTIRDATDEDEGEYTLKLSKWRGDASGSAKVKVLDYAVAWRKIDHQRNDTVKTALREFTPSNPEAQRLRFLLHGPVGAGKSSMANSVNTVFQGRTTVNAHAAPSTGKSETTTYNMYEIKDQHGRKLSFVFNDIMGLEGTETGGVLTADIISALKGHVKDGYKFNPSSPLSGGLYYNNNPTLDEKVHCLVSVMPAHKILLLEETHGLIMKMREVRDVAKNLEIPHVLLMTHVDSCPLVKEDLDKIYFSKKIKIAMENCSVKLGVPMNRIFPVKNYHEENCVDEKVDCVILDALDNIVNFANDYVIRQIE